MSDASHDEPRHATEDSGRTAESRRADRPWFIAAVVAGLALVGFLSYVVLRPTHMTSPVASSNQVPATSLHTGDAAPGFTLSALEGGAPVSLATPSPTPTIVNFFASWCHNCQAELRSFASLAAAHGEAIRVLGIDSNDASPTTAQSLLAAAGATYPVGADPKAAVATRYLLNALPVTFFINTAGSIVHVGVGTQSPAELAHWAAVLLGTQANS